MNVHSDKHFAEAEQTFLSPEDELLIERLVDGELSDEEREELIYKLDETIDGWRFCALSFLEEQTFRSALKNVSKAPLSLSEPEVRLTPSVRSNSPRKTFHKAALNYALSASAGFLIAAAALGGFDVWTGARPFPSTTNALVSTSAPSRAVSNDDPTADVPKNATSDAQEELATASAQPIGNSLLNDSVVPRTIVLNSPSQGLSNVVTTCEEVDNYDPRTFHGANSAIPQEVVNHMYNVGGSLDSHRDEYRFPLDGNRVLILPVDTYNVKSDGNQTIW